VTLRALCQIVPCGRGYSEVRELWEGTDKEVAELLELTREGEILPPVLAQRVHIAGETELVVRKDGQSAC